ncbi:MAG: HupE/UreJ family protein [Verrucomicrobiota bacterium]
MKTPSLILRLAFLAIALILPARAHDEPTSFIDVRLSTDGLEVGITASVTDLAHDLPGVEPAMLLEPATIAAQQKALTTIVASRLKIVAADEPLALVLREVTPLPDKRDLRLVYFHDWPAAPETLRLETLMFPYDPRHRTFVNVYAGDRILRQDILNADSQVSEFRTTNYQGIPGVVGQYIREGIHHISIGPDHILFVVGLMLLGGGLGRLLKIVTAFTIAHSITLGLATFNIISPPASIVEPVIALSIVFVGIHAFVGKKGNDPRLLFAFCFGLIHGFGFANVLQEMVLPQEALGWSLFAFNAGVEIGQACIVLAIVPVLAGLRQWRTAMADRVVASAALCITTAGAFWFFQRVIG